MAAMTEPRVNGAERFEEARARVRAAYMQGISDILDASLAEFIMPTDRETIAQDAAQFTVFLMALKIVEARGQPLNRKNLLAAYWPIEKAIKRDLPGMLLDFARSQPAAVVDHSAFPTRTCAR